MASSITSNPKSIQAKTIQPAPVSMSTSSSAQNPSTLQSKIHKNSVPDPISRPEPVKPSHTDSDLRPPLVKKPALEARYNELLKVIGEVGKDIKPAYTNSKSNSDRLRKNIVSARNVLRECLSELDKISRNDSIPKNSNVMDLSIST